MENIPKLQAAHLSDVSSKPAISESLHGSAQKNMRKTNIWENEKWIRHSFYRKRKFPTKHLEIGMLHVISLFRCPEDHLNY